MKKHQNIGLDFVIDKLTNSVENTLTGEVFNTEIVRLPWTEQELVDFRQIIQEIKNKSAKFKKRSLRRKANKKQSA